MPQVRSRGPEVPRSQDVELASTCLVDHSAEDATVSDSHSQVRSGTADGQNFDLSGLARAVSARNLGELGRTADLDANQARSITRHVQATRPTLTSHARIRSLIPPAVPTTCAGSTKPMPID